MATTVPGGRYLKADGVTWQNANGEPIEVEPEAIEPVAAEVQPEPVADPEAEAVEAEAEAKPAKRSKK